MLQIEYQLTEQEFCDYHYYTCWRSPERSRVRLKYYILGPAFFLIVMAAIFYQSDGTSIQGSSIIMCCVGVLVLFLMIRFRMRPVFDKQAMKMIKQSSPGSVLPRLELTLSDNGIFGKTGVAEVKYSWSAFTREARANDCYYLYINIRQALVIPQRAFSSPAQRQEFEKLLLTCLPLETEFKNLIK